MLKLPYRKGSDVSLVLIALLTGITYVYYYGFSMRQYHVTTNKRDAFPSTAQVY